jgi:hypothetical protein
MEKLKAVWAWITENKKIVIPVVVAIALLILGMIFGSKIKGCIDKPADLPVVEEIK